MSMSKVAVVTGGTKGVGKEIVNTFRKNGIQTVCLARNIEHQDKYNKICDLADESMVKNTISEIMNDFGRVDILVNNAGVATTTDLLDMTLEEWDEIMKVNLTGSFLMCRGLLPSMIENKFGRIINIGSIAGVKRSDTASVAYVCSKYGITGLTKQIAPIYAEHGITVNCLCPSQIGTEMLYNNIKSERIEELKENNPSKRLAKPEELADIVMFLTTESASYINGETINITGGII